MNGLDAVVVGGWWFRLPRLQSSRLVQRPPSCPFLASARLSNGMREKRKRGPTGGKGLAAGEKLDRKKLLQEGNVYDHWGWVRNEISDASPITTAHCLTVAGLAGGLSKANVCNTPYDATVAERLADECEDTIIVADTDAPACERKRCKNNPYCLTFLGQEQWVKEGELSRTANDPLLTERHFIRCGEKRVSQGTFTRRRSKDGPEGPDASRWPKGNRHLALHSCF